jgi:hypothetical protein
MPIGSRAELRLRWTEAIAHKKILDEFCRFEGDDVGRGPAKPSRTRQSREGGIDRFDGDKSMTTPEQLQKLMDLIDEGARHKPPETISLAQAKWLVDEIYRQRTLMAKYERLAELHVETHQLVTELAAESRK